MLAYQNIIGITGVVIILLCYYFLNIGKMRVETWSYLSLNLIGSCAILFSLFFDWNLSSVIIEFAWIVITLIGMVKLAKARN